MKSLVELASLARDREQTLSTTLEPEGRRCAAIGCDRELHIYRGKFSLYCWTCKAAQRQEQIREANRRYDAATGRKHPRRSGIARAVVVAVNTIRNPEEM